MSSRKRMTVFTPPTTLQVPTLVTTPASPTGKPPVRYRVEERTRTIYVTSEVPPSQWDSRNLGSLFSQTNSGGQPMRRTRSKVQTEYVITEDTPDSASSEPHSAPAILSPQRSRRSAPPSPIPPSPTPSAFRGPRPRILFYHKQDPYYGFTNFSPHPVKYKGKVYPTSEHLFQSFKACYLLFRFPIPSNHLSSSKAIEMISRSISGFALHIQVWPFPKPAAFQAT